MANPVVLYSRCTVCNTGFRLASELKLHYPVHFNGDQTTNQQPQVGDNETLHVGDNVKKVNDDVKIANRFTITINNLDENGAVGEFTVNISSDGS